MPSLKNSVAAQSSATITSSPGLYPAFSIDCMIKSSASVVLAMFGAKPPSSPTEVASPLSCRPFFSVWKISDPQRTASNKVSAPTGTIMNSWKSIGLSACSPPLMMFIIGTGNTCAATPPT